MLVVISRIHFTHSRHVHVWREQEAVNFDARDFRNRNPPFLTSEKDVSAYSATLLDTGRTRVIVLVDSQSCTGMLNEQVQDSNLATAEAFLDAALNFPCDEMAALGFCWEGAVQAVVQLRSVVFGRDLQGLLPRHDGELSSQADTLSL